MDTPTALNLPGSVHVSDGSQRLCEQGAHRETARRDAEPFPLANIGRDDWIRTSDPLTPSQVRYQAALHPEISYASEGGHRKFRPP